MNAPKTQTKVYRRSKKGNCAGKGGYELFEGEGEKVLARILFIFICQMASSVFMLAPDGQIVEPTAALPTSFPRSFKHVKRCLKRLFVFSKDGYHQVAGETVVHVHHYHGTEGYGYRVHSSGFSRGVAHGGYTSSAVPRKVLKRIQKV